MLDSPILGSRSNDGAKGIHQFAAGTVVQSQRQNHSGVAAGCIESPIHVPLDILGKVLLAADVLQANVVLVERGNFGPEISSQQPHEESDFGCWTLPVFFGERVKRKSVDMD